MYTIIRKTRKPDEKEQIENLTSIAINHINSMTPERISLRNLKFSLGEKPELYQHGIECISKIKGDARDLTIAFSNQLTVYNPKDINWNKYPHIRHGVTPYQNEVLIKAMNFMTDLAIKYSPLWVKCNVNIPKSALISPKTLEEFINDQM